MAGDGDGDWSALPADLLDLVSDHLALERDLLHVRQVCTHWRSSITSRPAAPFRPWVVACRWGSIGEYSLWLPRGVRRDVVSSPPELPYCCGTPRGWLALADDKTSPTQLVLWEPSSGTRIPLPPLARVNQVFLSADPLVSSDWTAVAAQRGSSVRDNLFSCRPGDAAWSAAAERGPYDELLKTRSAAFHAGKMYCVDILQTIAVYDVGKAGTAVALTPVIPQVMSIDTFGSYAAHFVTCNGDLLLLLLFQDRGPRPSFFPKVYRMGPQDLAPGRRELELRESERVEDLGGYSVFLGHGDAFALSVEEHPAIRRNCIYYIDHYMSTRNEVPWALVFDLESEAVEKIPFRWDIIENDHKQWWPCSWFCPPGPVLLKRH